MSTWPNLLFVDDEKNVLHIIRRELFDAPFNVLLAGSPREAFDILRQINVDMVISDIHMPDMDGVLFLEEVKKLYPRTVRIILSAFLDDTIVLDAITRGIASAFFMKPWNPDQFRLDCQQILSNRKILNDPDLLDLINNIGTLPSPPQLYNEFIAAVDQKKGSRQLAKILEQDAPLAVNILHMANSACFSAYKITSLERALTQLGYNIVKNMLLTLSLAHSFHWNTEQKNEIDRLLTHSSLVSRLTSLFYQQLHFRNLDEFTNSAALTHDIGKILLLYYFPEKYWQARELMPQEKGITFKEAEIRINRHHITHCEIGAYFLSLWNLSTPNIDAALFHHSPQAISGSNTRLVHLIALANLRANLPAAISGEEWLSVTEEMPFSESERRQLWGDYQFSDLMETDHGQ